ncbi:hypothetical protein [Actinokineospora sp. HUAS TT18]|uniref:hypothetical protein n=1 Tax=Actinokineospora sp. HUAS TT18 TaxID=3447451 RepID=UPI003F51ADC7
MSDDALFDELAAALRADREVPARFLDAGKAAFTWHSVDTELAELTHDSSVLAGTRGDAGRTLTFTAGAVTVEVEVTPDALMGQVVPPAAGEVEVVSRSGSVAMVPVDELGWFAVRPCPSGLIRLQLHGVHTEWTEL